MAASEFPSAVAGERPVFARLWRHHSMTTPPVAVWLPAVLVLQLVFVCGLSLVTAALDVYYRDVAYVVNAATLVLFWLCPIFYSFEDVPGAYAWLYEVNPVAAVILIMRRIFLDGVPPGLTIVKLAAVSVLTLWVGYMVFVRMEKNFSDYL